MVMIPSVPENSSTTIARWMRLARMSASTSSAPRACGTKSGWRISVGPVGGRRLAGGEEREHVLDVHHADHLVERVAIDRQARMAVLGEQRDQLVPAGVGGDGDDLAARDRHVVGVVLAEVEQVAQHRAARPATGRPWPAARRRRLLVLVLVDRFLELRAQRGLAVARRRTCGSRATARAYCPRLRCRSRPVGPVGHRPAHVPYANRGPPYGSAIPISASAFVSSASIASASAGEIS